MSVSNLTNGCKSATFSLDLNNLEIDELQLSLAARTRVLCDLIRTTRDQEDQDRLLVKLERMRGLLDRVTRLEMGL